MGLHSQLLMLKVDLTIQLHHILELLDSNVQKTGNHITLKYEEVEMFNHPLASRV